MISGLLPVIASDLSISLATAGQLITAFSFAYAISSPVLATLSGSLERRRLLLVALVLFTAANFLAFAAPGYWTLMGARVLLAMASGLYMPNANALAGALVPPERRGRALATVSGGVTIAVALGVPLGALIGHALSWRMTFACVGALSALVTLGVMLGLRRDMGVSAPTATLSRLHRTARCPHPRATAGRSARRLANEN